MQPIKQQEMPLQKLAHSSQAYRHFSLAHIVWFFITLLVFCALIKLAFWQLARAEEKDQRLARIAEFGIGETIELENALKEYVARGNERGQKKAQQGQSEYQKQDKGLASKQATEQLNDLPVKFAAIFDNSWLFYLDNQPNKGVFGYRVIQMVMLKKSGSANETNSNRAKYLLVNLGWVKGSIDRNTLPNIKPIAGDYKLQGNIRYIEVGVQLAQQAFTNKKIQRIQQIEIEKLAQLIGKPLLPFVVYLDKSQSVGYEKNWQPIVMPPEKHRGYAFQWFSLAIAWLSLMSYAAWKSYKNNNRLSSS